MAQRRVIEYQPALNVGSDRERKGFLADIASFANAAGGLLLYGSPEREGYPTDLPAVEIEGEDALLLQLKAPSEAEGRREPIALPRSAL